jgi:hypothetical protein
MSPGRLIPLDHGTDTTTPARIRTRSLPFEAGDASVTPPEQRFVRRSERRQIFPPHPKRVDTDMDRRGVEPRLPTCEVGVIPLDQQPESFEHPNLNFGLWCRRPRPMALTFQMHAGRVHSGSAGFPVVHAARVQAPSHETAQSQCHWASSPAISAASSQCVSGSPRAAGTAAPQ